MEFYCHPRGYKVALLANVRAVAKMLLIYQTESRPFISPPHQEREIDPSAISPDFEDSYWKGKRTGKQIPKLELIKSTKSDITTAEVHQFLSQHILATHQIRPATDLVTKLSGASLLGEYLYILRPLVYGNF
jgi:peroxin-16